MDNKIKILQISDIHWQKTLELADDYKDIQELMLQDVRYYCKHNEEKFDRILICGDIAFSGQLAEYKKAETFIQQLCHIIGCKTTDVNMIPGNHDRNVDADFKTTRELLHKAFDVDKECDKKLENLLLSEFETYKMLNKPFEQYAIFANDTFDSAESLMYNSLQEDYKEYDRNNDTMYWVSEFETKLSGYSVYLYGFNTAFTSDLNDYDVDNDKRKDGHKLFLPKITYNPASLLDGRINIMMAHHPMGFIHNGESIQKDLDKKYKLQLYGHVHMSNAESNADAIHIFSGSFEPGAYDTSIYRPTYNIIELSVKENENKEDLLHVDLQVHYWNGKRFEQDNDNSKSMNVKLLASSDRFDNSHISDEQKLPEGVTQRDIRSMFKGCEDYQDIIESLYPGRFDTSTVRYRLNQSFLEQVRIDKRWLDLYYKLEEQ